MAKGKHQTTTLDRARDELYSHIHRCAVLDANEEQQKEWMEDTLDFLRGRYPELSAPEVKQLRELGLRFCRPIIPHGRDNTGEAEESAPEGGEGAMAATGAEEARGDASAA